MDGNQRADRGREFAGARRRALLVELCITDRSEAGLCDLDVGYGPDRDCDDDDHAEHSVFCLVASVFVGHTAGRSTGQEAEGFGQLLGRPQAARSHD